MARTSSKHTLVHSESLRKFDRNPLEEGNPPPCDDFDPPIVEDYYSEDESAQSPDTNLEVETLLEEITNSLERLTLRNITNLNPHSHNITWSNMSGETITPPIRGTSTAGSIVVNPSSTSELQQVLEQFQGLLRKLSLTLQVGHFHMECL